MQAPPQRKSGPTPAHPPKRPAPAAAPANRWLPRLNLLLGLLLVLAALLAASLQPAHRVVAGAPPSAGEPAWWLYPLERHPELRLPRVSGDLAGVFALPGSQRVWVVGQRGLILHSGDGGLAWTQQHPLPGRAGEARPSPVSGVPLPPLAWLPQWIAAAHAAEPPADSAIQSPVQRPAAPSSLNVVSPIQQTVPVGSVSANAPPANAPPTEADLAAQKSRLAEEELKRAASKSPLQVAPRPTVRPPAQVVTPPSAKPRSVPRIPPDADLVMVRFDAAAKGWVASAQGIALISEDGGRSWTQPADAAQLRALFPDAAAQLQAALQAARAYAPQAIAGIPAQLLATAYADELRGWSVGRGGVIVATVDGGKTWHRQTRAADAAADRPTAAADGYLRLPAPWTYIAFLAGLGVLLRAGRQLGQLGQAEPPVRAGIAGLFVSDHPLGPGDPDPLGHNLVAQGLANFILNRNTEPGITMAITGSWGSGKSSIMRLLLYRLDEAGFRPAWFNAWHHQQEGRQLASLFNTIRQQAVPPLHTPAAWRVRTALFWGRGWPYRALALGILALVLVGGFEAARQPAPLDSLQRAVAGSFTDTRPVVVNAASLQKLKQNEAVDAQIVAALEANMLWSRQPGAGCRVVGGDCEFADVAQLLASLQELLKPRRLTDEERSAVEAAAQHLGAGPQSVLAVLLAALVVPLLLGKGLAVYGLNYLDLLKRLLPERGRAEGKEAVGTMENLRAEFALLTEALDGRLVLFIDDLDRCSCQTVREVLELVNYLASVGQCFIVLGMAMEHVACCIEPKTEDQDRQAYALQYLKKLINIEVPVPVMDPERSREMLSRQAGATERPAPPGVWRDWLGHVAILAAVLALSWALPQFWGSLQPRSEPRAFVVATDAGAQPVAPLPVDSSVATVAVGLEPAAAPATAWWLAPLPVALLAGVLLWLTRARWQDWLHRRGLLPALRRVLGQATRKDDSPDFGATLLGWHPVIIRGDPTPRGVKRFVNRVRFLAMMEQSQPEAERIPDTLLVALAALHHAGLGVDGDSNADARAAIAATPGWPPAAAQFDRFERLMSQLHIR